jgi:hypothetical protein
MAATNRRTPSRPHPGEMKACPQCGQMMRFEERLMLVQGVSTSDPAWVCLNKACGSIERVRM